MYHDVRFKTSDSLTAKEFHEDLCKAIHEGDEDHLARLARNVYDVLVLDPSVYRGDKNLTHLYPTLLDRVKKAFLFDVEAARKDLGVDGIPEFSEDELEGYEEENKTIMALQDYPALFDHFVGDSDVSWEAYRDFCMRIVEAIFT
jgi:hypothetical protein